MTSPKRPFIKIAKRVALRQWLILTAILLLLAGCLGYQNGLAQLDQPLYDQFMRLDQRPARNDIIIVGIDDYSISQLGRWPWPRDYHAKVINNIMQAHPLAIGLDVIMPEPETIDNHGLRDGDINLAKALAASNKTVLPIVTTAAGTGVTSLLPIPEFQHAARALGHISLELDRDGIMRGIFLKEGQNGIWWPHFAVALADIAGQKITNQDGQLPGEHRDQHGSLPIVEGAKNQVNAFAGATSTEVTLPQTESSSDQWQRDYHVNIRFSGDRGSFRSVPYISVLRGEVPRSFFNNKYVLIGATAIGMADAFPTPVSGSSGIMPGVEINANILSSLLDHTTISIASAQYTVLFSVLPLLIALISYLFLTPRLALILTGLLMLLVTAISYIALKYGLWIAPSAALISLGLAYPLWSWCRLEAAITYLGHEFMLLDQEPHLLPEVHRIASSQLQGEDLLEQRINAMRNAARRVRDLRHFVSDSLDSLPDATLITTTDGHVLIANQVAKDYFHAVDLPDIANALPPYLFSKMSQPQPLEAMAQQTFDWFDLLDTRHQSALSSGLAVQDQHGHDLLIKSAPCYSAHHVLSGWIVSIIDITSIRAAERSRDETLRFLSHDMRAPQASILALLELQGDASSALPQQEFFSRIEHASRKTLGLADNFVQLARAESEEYRLEEVDFQDVIIDATDEMWILAQNKGIKLLVDIATTEPNGDDTAEFITHIDRGLMARALCNLIANAINYSPVHTTITCSLRHELINTQPHIVCCISDQGYGISAADQAKLFQRFQRIQAPGQPKSEGIGLGLVFVKTVVERHFGEISFTSEAGKGTKFVISLPELLKKP
ncbi:CHASE2 domain-containing protein [Glaciimonas soli]|uniref:histidine kinase n=1 Tax=Glaciimonas soli TaxID=2590999 RepID=A0A843YXN3_9BURK|nr:CHASE2 domain-containing protein [Glaciimonas soli]MQR02228.1 CHASE2 domain-containing protein [Glaciimonas soli]